MAKKMPAIPQAALQACAAEGGCALVSRARLAAMDAAAFMRGAAATQLRQAQPAQDCRRMAPGWES